MRGTAPGRLRCPCDSDSAATARDPLSAFPPRGHSQRSGAPFLAALATFDEADSFACTGLSVSGAVIATTPSGTIAYRTSTGVSTTATMTDSSGFAYVFNVPVGDVTATAMVGAMVLRSHIVGSYAASPTFTDIQP